MSATTKLELSDDLKANFRSWEQDCDNETAARLLALTLLMRHPKSGWELCYEFAKDWTGYDEDE